uniref:Anaphase-promoting complex subunit 4 WD40 domain-containing protein n=1 Tax=Gadus morhua TaxID=8049 RepID=A0A8C5CRE3_GADMO
MEEVVQLVSSGDCVKIWDSVSMTTCEQFLPHSATHPVSQVCWSSNNQYLVSASSVGDKLVVSSLKASPVPVIELAEGKRQTRVCLSSSSQYLLSGGLDHTVNLWDLKSRRLHRCLKDHKEEVTCVSFNANDTCVASGSTSGDLILHGLTTNLSSKPFGHGANQPIHDLRLCPLKRSLLGSVSDGGTVALWDSNTQKELHVFDGAHKAPGSGLAFSPASDLLFISAGLDKKIICYDTASKIILRVIRAEAPLTAVDFSPDGLGVVVGSTQGKIYHYDLRNPSSPTRVTPAHKTSVTCLRYQSSSSKQPKVPSHNTPCGGRFSGLRLVTANHTLTWWCNMSPLRDSNPYHSPPLRPVPPPVRVSERCGPVSPGAAELSSSVAAQLEGVCAQGGAPLSALQTHFIQNMIHDTLEEFRDTCHRDIVNLQVEMIRQFYIQLKEIHGLIEKYSLNDSLLEEIQKLREENRKHFNY